LFALFLTAILSPPVHFLRRHGWPSFLATAAVFLFALGVVVALGFWFVPRVANQFEDVGKQASQGFKDVQHWLTHAPFRLKQADEMREIGRRSWDALGGYIRGTAVNGVVNGTVMGLTLAVLGVPLALPLAVLTFVGAFIPIIGAIVTGVLAALIALVAKGGV